jgi:RNA polymerase sigma-54 factor
MTPQLQQAIRLLQMSTLDLQQEIQQALDSNLMLELEDEYSNFQPLEKSPEAKAGNSDIVTSEGSQTDLPDELPIDSSWGDVYEDDYESSPTTSSSQSDGIEFETLRGTATTLVNHLAWQLDLARFSERDHEIVHHRLH